MSMDRHARLSRLVRVARIIYRRESAELARKHIEVRDADNSVAEAEKLLDAPLTGGDFLSQLSVVRAARARKQLTEANEQFSAQRDATIDAMSKKKGAESELDLHALEQQQFLGRRDADEMLERIARPEKASLG